MLLLCYCYLLLEPWSKLRLSFGCSHQRYRWTGVKWPLNRCGIHSRAPLTLLLNDQEIRKNQLQKLTILAPCRAQENERTRLSAFRQSISIIVSSHHIPSQTRSYISWVAFCSRKTIRAALHRPLTCASGMFTSFPGLPLRRIAKI